MWRCFSEILIGRMGARQSKDDTSTVSYQNDEEITGIDAQENIGQREELAKDKCEEEEEEEDDNFSEGLEYFEEFIKNDDVDFEKPGIATAATQVLKVEQRIYVSETSKFHVHAKQKVLCLDDEGDVVVSVEQREQGYHTRFPKTCFNVSNSNSKGSIMYFQGTEEKNGFELHSGHGVKNKEETSLMNNSAKK